MVVKRMPVWTGSFFMGLGPVAGYFEPNNEPLCFALKVRLCVTS